MTSNDPDIEIMFVSDANMISRSQMHVVLSENFNRRKLPVEMEEHIERVWEERVNQNPKLYNGTKFRIDTVFRENETLRVNLGVTCYKEYIGSNWSPQVKKFQALGLESCKNSQVYLSDPLGVGSLVVTSDSFIILLRRSLYCGEAPGLWDIPGGHAEPEELVGKKMFEEIQLAEMEERAVVDEIYDSIIREIRDEVNLPESSLTDPRLMGIARNTTSAGRPSMEFVVRCSLTAKEVVSLYQKGSQAEADESTNIKIFPLSDVATMQLNSPDLWSKLAPSAKGCFILYRLSHDLDVNGIKK